jgi:GNAT superfamily N-acetyltransferase
MSRSDAARAVVRLTADADVDAVVAMVHELAAYERAPGECQLTAAQLRAALFGPSPALFCHVAAVGPEVVGFALWFLNFSTWRGVHGIYLEDLYVRPAFRGGGVGRALLAELAAECVRRGYARLEWWVLDWNEPAIGVYRAIGALPMDDWTVYRLTGPALDALAHTAGSHADHGLSR